MEGTESGKVPPGFAQRDSLGHDVHEIQTTFDFLGYAHLFFNAAAVGETAAFQVVSPCHCGGLYPNKGQVPMLATHLETIQRLWAGSKGGRRLVFSVGRGFVVLCLCCGKGTFDGDVDKLTG